MAKKKKKKLMVVNDCEVYTTVFGEKDYYLVLTKTEKIFVGIFESMSEVYDYLAGYPVLNEAGEEESYFNF